MVGGSPHRLSPVQRPLLLHLCFVLPYSALCLPDDVRDRAERVSSTDAQIRREAFKCDIMLHNATREKYLLLEENETGDDYTQTAWLYSVILLFY